MIQPFKTISLEERLKQSRYNQLPTRPGQVDQGASGPLSMPEVVDQGRVGNLPTPQPVDQGKIELKKRTEQEYAEGIELKQIPNAPEKNSAILQNYIATRPQQVLPVIQPFRPTSITSFAIPLPNTNFRTSISLANRLNQTNLGTTNHLPQVFLADLYTNFITITPFGVFNHTSNTILSMPGETPLQGGFTPAPILFTPNHSSPVEISEPIQDILTSQGAVFANGQYSSAINVVFPIENILQFQGVVEINGQIGSITNITLPSTVEEVNQGNGTTPEPALSVNSILLTQGVDIDPAGNIQSLINIQNPIAIPIFIPPSIVIVNSGPTPMQGGVDPTPFNFIPQFSTPILEVLAYSADRALAFFTPEIKHGSSFVATSIAPSTEKSAAISPLLNGTLSDAQAQGTLEVFVEKWNYSLVGQKSIIGISGIESSLTITNILSSTESMVISDFVKGIADPTISKHSFKAPAQSEAGNGSLAQYKTLSYGQIAQRASQVSTQREDFRTLLGINVTPSPSVNERGANAAAENDFITLKVASMTGQGSVQFSSYITSFTDGLTINWSDINYIGRQDTLKAFKGTVRGGSIGFKVVAIRKDLDLPIVYSKLNNLIKIAGVGKSGVSENTYITGPLCKLTVGNWFTNTPCIFNSIKYDVQMAEYTWDIDKKMPHLVDVSLDFVILGDRVGTPLNASTNDYFNYIG